MARSKQTARRGGGGGHSSRSLSQRPPASTSASTSGQSSRHESPFASQLTDPAPTASTSGANPNSHTRPRLSNDSDSTAGGMKRSLSNDEDTSRAAKRRKPKKKKTKDQAAPVAADSEEEEGQVDEFAGLFMIDTAPSAILPDAPVEPEPPARPAVEDEWAEKLQQSELEREEEAMRAFVQEVADSDASLSEDEDEADESQVFAVYDDPDALQKAIQGKITDDSAAKVTGRYYKEVDLTRSCGLCGEQGHTSRDCPHAQCFTCGLVDGDHEARNCPVSLVCSACGSRGHFARDCSLPHGSRSAYGARCATCSSNLHAASNCPSLWRVYDLEQATASKHKVVLACANDGSTGNHFIDDCLLPRMHPMRYADPSAFNAAALSDPRYAGTSSQHRSGGASGAASSARRRGAPAQPFDEEPADDDWFASRGAGGNPRGSGASRRRERNARNDSNGDFDAPPPPSSRGPGGSRSAGRSQKPDSRKSGGGGGRGSASHHIHFDGGLERFGGSPAGGRAGGYRDRDQSSHDSPREMSYGGRSGKSSQGGRKEESTRREDRRDEKGRRDDSRRQPDPPRESKSEARSKAWKASKEGGASGSGSLSSRLAPAGPSYRGGYY